MEAIKQTLFDQWAKTIDAGVSKIESLQSDIEGIADAIDIGGYNKTTPVERCISGGVWEIDESINDHPHSPVIVLFQVTDDEKRTEYLAWIEASVPPNDSKKFEFSWTPAKTGQHTLTVFTWKSLDNPTALLSPTATSVNVND